MIAYSKILDLVNQKELHPYDCKGGFEKFKEELTSKEKFYSSLKGKKLVIKSISFGLDLELEQ